MTPVEKAVDNVENSPHACATHRQIFTHLCKLVITENQAPLRRQMLPFDGRPSKASPGENIPLRGRTVREDGPYAQCPKNTLHCEERSDMAISTNFPQDHHSPAGFAMTSKFVTCSIVGTVVPDGPSVHVLCGPSGRTVPTHSVPKNAHPCEPARLPPGKIFRFADGPSGRTVRPGGRSLRTVSQKAHFIARSEATWQSPPNFCKSTTALRASQNRVFFSHKNKNS